MIMRKLLPLTFVSLFVLPAVAQDNEAEINATLENRYKEWIAAANKKDAAALTNLYDENAVVMPKSEEPVLGKAAMASITKSLSPTRILCRSH
jgi:ketosteroid isomerase-like protein